MEAKRWSLWQRVKGVKGIGFLLAAVACALVLLWLGGVSGEKTGENGGALVVDPAEYREGLERELTQVLSGIKGAGTVQVIVMLEGGEEQVMATGAGGGWGLAEEEVVGRRYPAVRGVGVVCSGGADAFVRSEVIGLCCAILDLPSHRIYVAGGR